MTRGRRWGIVAIAFAVGAAPAHAGSRYSLRGDGEPVLPGRADVRAIGGAQAAGGTASISGNPASLSLADRTCFYGTWVTEWIRVEEPTSTGVLKNYDGFLPNLGLVFPMPWSLRFGTGLLVDRRQSGIIERSATTPDGRPYRELFEASGNLLRIPVLFARDFGPAQLGTGLDVLLLNSKIRWRNDFPDGSGFADSDDRDEQGLWGVGWRVGGRLPLGQRLALGAWGSFPGRLSGQHRLKNAAPSDSSETLEIDAHADIAREMGAGVELKPRDGWRLAFDWTRQAWSEVDAPSPVDELVDVDRMGVGVEWTPSTGGGLRWPVRLGYRTERLHALDGGGREIREHALSGGSGFSFADGRGEFDWFLEYAWRGEADISEFREQVVRFGVTLTGLEEWQGRRPPEDETEDW